MSPRINTNDPTTTNKIGKTNAIISPPLIPAILEPPSA